MGESFGDYVARDPFESASPHECCEAILDPAWGRDVTPRAPRSLDEAALHGLARPSASTSSRRTGHRTDPRAISSTLDVAPGSLDEPRNECQVRIERSAAHPTWHLDSYAITLTFLICLDCIALHCIGPLISRSSVRDDVGLRESQLKSAWKAFHFPSCPRCDVSGARIRCRAVRRTAVRSDCAR